MKEEKYIKGNPYDLNRAGLIKRDNENKYVKGKPYDLNRSRIRI